MAKISSVKVDSKIPEGPLAEKWTNYKAHQKLVNPVLIIAEHTITPPVTRGY